MADSEGPMPRPEPVKWPIREPAAPAGPQAAQVGAATAWDDLRRNYGTIAPIELEPGLYAWLLLGYSANLRVLRDTECFSSDPRLWRAHQEGHTPQDPRLRSRTTFRRAADRNDGASHTRLRSPLADGLARFDKVSIRDDVHELADLLIDAFAPHGQADLVADYTTRLPLLVLNRIFGLDDHIGQVLADLVPRTLQADEERAAEAAEWTAIYLTGVVERAKRNPGSALPHLLLSHPAALDKQEVVQALAQMLDTACEATAAAMANTLRALLADARLRSEYTASMVPPDALLNHVVWTDPPLGMLLARYARRDVDIDGVAVRRGDAVVLCWPAAHDDPAVRGTGGGHTLPGIVDNRAHLAWGAGPHHCPGQALATQIITAGIDHLLHRLPGMALAVPAVGLSSTWTPHSRQVKALPVWFTPAPAPKHRAPTQGSPPPPNQPEDDDLLTRLSAWWSKHPTPKPR